MTHITGFSEAWDRYFFSNQSIENFRTFRFLIFFYIFIAVGFSGIEQNATYEKIWDPISFFSFFEYSTWTSVCAKSFYLIKISAFLSAVNVFYKCSSKVCFVSMVFNLGYFTNFGKVFHGFHFLVITVGLMSLVSRPKDITALWPIPLIKVYAVFIYFMAGVGKLISSGFAWVFSDNLYAIIARNPGKPWLGQQILKFTDGDLVILSFWVVFLFQLPSIFALFSRRCGIYLFFTASLFHLGVHFTLGGHYAFLSQIVCLLVFLPLDVIKNRAREMKSTSLTFAKRHYKLLK